MHNVTSHLLFAAVALSAAQSRVAGPSGAAVDKPTPQQTGRLQEKLQLTQTILSNVSQDAAAKGATSEWRESLAALLYMQTNENLRAIAPNVHTLNEAHAIATSAQSAAAKALGDANNDLVFTPITPCRFIDTRNVGGPVGAVRVFDTANTGATYGGSAACALSGLGEPAIALNATIVSPTTTGYLVIRPQGSSNVSSFLNWDASTLQEANAGIITTTAESNGHYEFEMFTDAGTPQVIVDYFGYFSAPAGTITGNGGAGDGVDGATTGAFNSGVFGKNTGGGKGVFGASATGQGVAGQSTSGDGMTGNSATGSGVYGQTAGASGQSGAAGVWGDSHDYYGIWGTSISGDGVHGNTNSAAGNMSGVAGIGGGANTGVTGLSTSGNGVQGLTAGTGVSGVYGHNTTGYGVYGRSDSGYAMGTDGPVFQAANQGGWVKAMVVVEPSVFSSQHIYHCFNSQLPAAQASTPPCGMVESEPTSGQIIIDVGFDVTQRFPVATIQSAGNPDVTLEHAVIIGACMQCTASHSQVLITMERPDTGDLIDVPFTLVIY
jgi:hypothetical protein